MKLYYNEETAVKTIEEFDKVFIKKEIPDDIPEVIINDDTLKLVDLLTDNNLAESKTAARKLIEQGAVSINGRKETDVNSVVIIINGMVLKVGKRKFLKILK